MGRVATIPAVLALCVAAIAATSDCRRGEIPNWVTLPPLVIAPLGYGLTFGIGLAMNSLGAAALSGLVPYLLFRRGAIGGGDVKLFAALGAITGFDLVGGIEILLTAVVVAMLLALSTLAWRGSLLSTLGNAFMQSVRPVLPARWHRSPCDALTIQVRMGGPVLLATIVFAAPHIALAWSEN